VAGGDAWIVGIGETRHAPRRDDVSTTELAWEAVAAALEDAGVLLADVHGAVTASQDFWEGRTISSMAVNEIVGATLGSEAKVASDGAQAVAYARARVVGGAYGLTLVLAHCKESQADPHGVELAAMDPFYQRPLDPDEWVAAGLQAEMLGYPTELRARAVAAARARSPWLGPLSAAEVEASPEASTPLRALERAPRADGACALVLADGTTAAGLDRPLVRIASAQTSTDPFWTDRELTRAPAAADARDRALREAGWDELPELLEVAAPFAHQLLLWSGELGIGAPEQVVERLEAGNGLAPRGGWLAGVPTDVAGLSAVAGCAARLRERPGRALAHGAAGLLGQSHHVVLLESG
jgi:acetyl-CoA C-acetyltransferase